MTALKLFCWVLGGGIGNVFPVEIQTTKTVGALKEVIKKKKKKAFEDVDADTLVLWKVSISLERGFKESISAIKLDEEESLLPWKKLSEVFLDPPAENQLHIIVRPPPTVVEPSSGPNERGLPINKREQIAQAARHRPAPSTAAKASEQYKIQRSSVPHCVYNWRPYELQPPLVAPYFPGFATFVHDLSVDDVNPLTSDELTTAFDLVTQSVSFYPTEDKRLRRISPLLFKSQEFTYRYKSQPELSTREIVPDVHRTSHCPYIMNAGGQVGAHSEFVEVKLEIGEGGSDAIAQAESSYVTVYTSEEARPIRDISCCPALLIGICGPYIIFSAAVFARVLISQRLTDYIFLGPRAGERDDDAIRRVARMLRALNKLRNALDAYYMSLESENHYAGDDDAEPRVKRRKITPPPFIGPTFAEFSMDGRKYKLEYLKQLDPDPQGKNVGKTVFHAHMMVVGTEVADTGHDVVVKFATTYGKEGHELLANHSSAFAPALWYCEMVDELGRLWMIVMDYVEGGNYKKLDNEGYNRIKQAITLLHDNGLVFGDLRLPNVLASKGGAMLVDFDWCGKANEARYPASINLVDIEWHEDVGRGARLHPDHDCYMLDQLVSS